MPGCSIEWIVIPAVDVQASRAFYTAVFGFVFSEYSPTFVPFEAGNLAGALDASRAPAQASSGVAFSLTVPAMAPALEAVATHGGSIVKEAYSLGPDAGFCAAFQDPAGNVLELYSAQA